jgi:putative hydrolase
MDINGEASAWLRDMAALQTDRPKRLAYERAAAAVWEWPDPIDAAGGALPRIPFVGPSSARIVMEVISAGRSATVEKAIAASGRGADVVARRTLAERFLSGAEARRVLREPAGVRLASQYAGDLQMHSTWSDGHAPIAELAAACAARGQRFCAVTDHSHGLPVARGMARDRVPLRHAEIDRLNRELGSRFRVIKGVEANILADGDLDLSLADRQAFELILAAPHSRLRTAEDQTARILRAVGEPGVGILAHGRGRKLGARAGLVVDWPRVFARAAERDVAIEIDGDPMRQDLDFELARQALAAGCLFALDSDAHGPDELGASGIAIAHAALAGIPPDQVVNCWKPARLLAWIDARQTSLGS